MPLASQRAYFTGISVGFHTLQEVFLATV